MAESQGLYSQGKDQTGLTRRQRDVVRLLTVEGKSQLEVSVALGISRQRVNQIIGDLKTKGVLVQSDRYKEVTAAEPVSQA